MSQVILCIPPDYDYYLPTLATPVLSSFLHSNGIACEQIDLNLQYRDFLIQNISSSLELSVKNRRQFLRPLLKEFFNEMARGRYYSELLPRKSDGVSVQLPYGNNSNSSFYFCERLLSSEYLWQYLEDYEENTYLQFFKKRGILDFIEGMGCSLLALSITSPSQVIASFTLGLLVKKHLPQVHVVIGGQWPTLFRSALYDNKVYFRCFDTVICFDGTVPLLELALALKKKQDLLNIPNLMFHNSSRSFDACQIEDDLNKLGCPDFSGLALSEYEGNKNGKSALTYEASRGCYWSRCAYCVDLPLPRPTYRVKNPDSVVKDLKYLKEKFNAGNIFFSDPGMSPRLILEISREIIKSGVHIEWRTFARLDPGFNRKIFDIAAQAGLEQVNFGFESASDRVCDLLDKGNRKERSERIIKECAQAGIRVGLQTMLGLPQESFEDGLETIDFLVRNKEFASITAFNAFYLTPGNGVYLNPDKYGIVFEKERNLPFRFFTPFKNLLGMDIEKAGLLEKIYDHFISEESLQSAPTDNGKACIEGYVEFTLNQESVRLRCLRNLINGDMSLMKYETIQYQS